MECFTTDFADKLFWRFTNNPNLSFSRAFYRTKFIKWMFSRYMFCKSLSAELTNKLLVKKLIPTSFGAKPIISVLFPNSTTKIFTTLNTNIFFKTSTRSRLTFLRSKFWRWIYFSMKEFSVTLLADIFYHCPAFLIFSSMEIAAFFGTKFRVQTIPLQKYFSTHKAYMFWFSLLPITFHRTVFRKRHILNLTLYKFFSALLTNKYCLFFRLGFRNSFTFPRAKLWVWTVRSFSSDKFYSALLAGKLFIHRHSLMWSLERNWGEWLKVSFLSMKSDSILAPQYYTTMEVSL